MNRILFYIVLFCFCIQMANASPFSWADSIVGNGTGIGCSMVIDLDNNIYVCGQLTGNFQLSNNTTKGNTGFIIKYNSKGIIIWAVSLPGLTCKSLSIDQNQAPSMAGYFSDSVQIGNFKFKSAGKKDFFVMKFDTSGNIIWAQQGGGLGNDMAYSVANDMAGHTFITGSFENYVIFDSSTSILSLGQSDMFVAEYDSAGDYIWSANGGGNEADEGISVALDLEGDIFVTGYFNGRATFHNSTLQSKGGKNIFIIKYSPLGYQLAVRLAGGANDAIPNAMSLDGSGNIYLAGKFSGNASFGNKTLSASGNDGFVAAYDNNLNINWLHKIGGPGDDETLGIKADWQSNIFLTGVFSGTADMGGQNLSSNGLTDIFITKYDAAGRLLWTRNAGGTGADSSFSVSNDYNDIATITGKISNDAHFGDINLAADTGGSFFISQLQYDPAGIQTPITQASSFEMYPNPTNGVFTFQPNSALGDRIQVRIYDMAGREIQRQTQSSNQNETFDLSSLPDGIYFVTLQTDSNLFAEKIIKSNR